MGEAEDGEEEVGLVADASEGGGDLGVTGLADQADGEVTESGHDAGAGAGSGLGGVFVEGDVSDPVDFVLDRPMPPDVGGEVFRCGFPRGEARDSQDCDSGFDADFLVFMPIFAFAFAFDAAAYGAGDVPFDQEHPGRRAGTPDPRVRR